MAESHPDPGRPLQGLLIFILGLEIYVVAKNGFAGGVFNQHRNKSNSSWLDMCRSCFSLLSSLALFHFNSRPRVQLIQLEVNEFILKDRIGHIFCPAIEI